MHRFYVAPERITGETAVITGDELRHLVLVLRLGLGDAVAVFDGQGREYWGKIEALGNKEALVRIGSSPSLDRESPLEVWLAQGIAKGDKMELVIQKATELGVRGIIPLDTSRSVVRLTGRKREEKEKRWQRVALEATKQCGRTRIPAVFSSRGIPAFAAGLPRNKILLVPWENGGQPLKSVLQEKKENLPVYLVIGPEGGLEAAEVDILVECGGIPVTLGPRILRTETAGLAALAALMHCWGDLG